jgi:hypothetical protein
MGDDVLTVTGEARRRIDTARVRQIAFQIKNMAPTLLSDDDAEVLAVALVELLAEDVKVTGEQIRARLEKNGRAREAADHLASAVGL